MTHTERTERTALAAKMTEWAEIVDHLFNCEIVTPSGVLIHVPMVIGCAAEIEAWRGWSIIAR